MNSSSAGQILEHAIRRQNVNISELSRRMNVNRRTLYNWFNQEKLQMDIICMIGQVINYDFSDEFKDEFLRSGVKLIIDENDQHPINKEQSQESTHYWMQKYISLLEDYAALLQTINSSSQQVVR